MARRTAQAATLKAPASDGYLYTVPTIQELGMPHGHGVNRPIAGEQGFSALSG